MQTIVVTGGTAGIGQAIARTYLARPWNVVVIGPNPAKGRDFLNAARDAGAADRAVFVEADLSLVRENERVVEEITARFDAIDALVLCARYFQVVRTETDEGFEHNFALFYLSRYLLAEGLADALAKGSSPIIANVAGPGNGAGTVHWDDLGLRHGYSGVEALNQSGKLNDLLGASFAARRPSGPVRYALFNPGSTATSFAGEYDAATRPHIEAMKKFGKPVEASAGPIAERIDDPPQAPLSAFVEGRPLSPDGPDFDPGDAARLDEITRALLKR